MRNLPPLVSRFSDLSPESRKRAAENSTKKKKEVAQLLASKAKALKVENPALTQKQIGDALGVTQAAVSRYLKQ